MTGEHDRAGMVAKKAEEQAEKEEGEGGRKKPGEKMADERQLHHTASKPSVNKAGKHPGFHVQGSRQPKPNSVSAPLRLFLTGCVT